MVTLSSDFECGNGKYLRRLGDSHWRFEVDGDKQGGYCVYFCVEVANSGAATEATIEMWEDSQFGGPTAFPVFFPTTIWVQPPGEQRYRPLHEAAIEPRGDHVVFMLPLGAQETTRLALTYVAPYSDTCARLQALAAERADRCELFSLGDSVQGRELLGLRAGTPGRPRVLCIAGQHPHEHAGVWAALGLADFVSSLTPEAAALRERYEVQVVPNVNPDGNAAGRNAFNAEGLDPYPAFGDQPDADEPVGHEGRLVWRWAVAAEPAMWMNFHAYTGWRGNSEYPYEGWYEAPDRAILADPGQRRLYAAMCDAMRLMTDGPSTTEIPGMHAPSTICYQLAARYGIPHAFYELNNGTSGKHRASRQAIAVLRQVVAVLDHYRA